MGFPSAVPLSESDVLNITPVITQGSNANGKWEKTYLNGDLIRVVQTVSAAVAGTKTLPIAMPDSSWTINVCNTAQTIFSSVRWMGVSNLTTTSFDWACFTTTGAVSGSPGSITATWIKG